MSITCLAGAGRVHGALGFSWARERTLLPMAPGREVWEDLYPAGSVLKLYNVQVRSFRNFNFVSFVLYAYSNMHLLLIKIFIEIQ